jgi:2-dehydropantoate 2-reductase
MRILVLGAGAIGGYYGMQLAVAGADVRFLVRPGRAAQLTRDGLVLESRGQRMRHAVQTLQAGQVGPAFDLILLTCKAYDLPSAIAAIAPAVGPGAVVLPLLNGLAHFDDLDARFGRDRVLGGLCYIAVALGSDGIIRHTSPTDEIRFGSRTGSDPAQARTLADLFARTPVKADLSSDIVPALWEKWCMIAASAALTCLLRGTVGEIAATDDGAAVATALMAECQSVAAACGFPQRPEAIERTRRQLTDPASKWAASMMRDIEANVPRLEADHIIGDLIRRGSGAGVAMPMLRAAFAQMQIYNARGAARVTA